MSKTVLITGITSQDGGYLAKLLVEQGYTVVGLVRSITSQPISNLEYLDVQGVILECVDLLYTAGLYNLFNRFYFF